MMAEQGTAPFLRLAELREPSIHTATKVAEAAEADTGQKVEMEVMPRHVAEAAEAEAAESQVEMEVMEAVVQDPLDWDMAQVDAAHLMLTEAEAAEAADTVPHRLHQEPQVPKDV